MKRQLRPLLCLLCAFCCLLTACGGGRGGGAATTAATQTTPVIAVPDPSTAVRLALVFDYNVSDITTENGFDFVWGGEPQRAQAASNRTLYETFDRSSYQTLAWFQQNHPAWIVYECDGVTPAWHNDGTGTQYVPLDIANPEVVQFQVDAMSGMLGDPANGYAGVAFDNLNLDNSMSNAGAGEKRCGTLDANGVFQAKWADLGAYQQSVIGWASAMRSTLQQRFPGMSVAINFAYDPRYPDASNQLLEAVDIAVDEEGFSRYGSGYLADAAWRTKVQVLSRLLARGERVVVINQVVGTVITPEQTQWALASYLMIAGPMADIFICRQQEYGSVPDWLRTLVVQNPTGQPSGTFSVLNGVYRRNFAKAIALVNPQSATSVSVSLGGSYRDLYGNQHSGSVVLGPHSGIVLFPN